MRRLGIAGAALVIVILVGCSQEAPPVERVETRQNVIFILVDTLRADHMSLYGYERPTTPFLEELARESAVFDRARSQAGCTYPSVNSMLTSRYTVTFYSRGNGDMGIPEDLASIQTTLKSRGYSTAAISASPIVRKTPSRFNPSAGFGHGFDVFDEACLWRPAGCVNQRALEVLKDLQEPFFLYLHYMDPHGPYRPPPTHERRFASSYVGLESIAAGDPNPISEMLYGDGPKIDYTAADIQHLVDLYDDEILYFDSALRRLVRTLGKTGVLDRSILLLTSDHGEEFLEHGHVKHCRGVWDTLTHVPLLMRFPQNSAERRIYAAVQGVDIFPTLLDSLGIDDTGLSLEGASVLPLVDGASGSDRLAYSDQGKYRSVDNGRYHLILDLKSDLTGIFDVRNDPLEQHDLSTDADVPHHELRLALEDWLRDTGQGQRIDEALRAAQEQEDQLRALGYIQ